MDHMELNIGHMTLMQLQTITSRERGTGIGLMELLSPHGKRELALDRRDCRLPFCQLRSYGSYGVKHRSHDIDAITDYHLTRKRNWHRIDGTVNYHCANSGHMELNIDHMTLILLQTATSRARGTGIGLMGLSTLLNVKLDIDHLTLILIQTMTSIADYRQHTYKTYVSMS
ncbi:hypothetical protein J6590_075809 [Homalodisca vitripennis]|nr:hypothetical protein J6590_075809 [Homalodisca vitripennis]